MRDPAARFMKVPSFGKLESTVCGLCGGARSELVTSQHVFGENFQVVRCQDCGLIRTNPRPSEQWKENFYNPNCNGYAESQGRDFVYAPSPTRVPGYRRLLAFLVLLAPPGAKLLDVGCAAGLFVKEAIDCGFDATGCDYSENAVIYGKEHFGVHIIRSPAESINAADDTYEVVTILHVFEHLPEPMRVLRELRRVLKPGGLLLLETVNYRPHYEIERRLPFCIPIYNFLTKRQGLPWMPFDHLYHWSADTLKEALLQAGFRDVQFNHLRGYRSEMKPNAGFAAVYSLAESVARGFMAISGGRWDFWPVLLATSTK
jgi:2-polyprenyl-3-methyl-5-hydroxy-6-metoxy-1,4-benzoquinol methylase